MKRMATTEICGRILAVIVLFCLLTPPVIITEGEDNAVDYIFDYVYIDGTSTGEKAIFNLTGTFYVTEGKMIPVKILGPPSNLGIISLKVDNTTVQIFFTSEFYYFERNLSQGNHQISLEFEIKLGGSIQRGFNFIIFGPALRYYVEFEIPKHNDTLINLVDPHGATVNELNDKTVLSWDYYGIEEQHVNPVWNEQKRFTSVDLETQILTLVTSAATETTIDRYILLNFRSSKISNITIHFPTLGIGADVEPLLFSVPSSDPLYPVIEDTAWDPDTLTLYLYFSGKPYGERLLILKQSVVGRNVTISPIAIPESDSTRDFVAYHALPGMRIDIKEIENLASTSQGQVDEILTTNAGLTSDHEIYEAVGKYNLVLNISKIFSQSCTIFHRIWISSDKIHCQETMDIEAPHHVIFRLLLPVNEDVAVTDVTGADDWKVEDGFLSIGFWDGLLGSQRITIHTEMPTGNLTIVPLVPMSINITGIYTVIGLDDSIKVEVSAVNATSMKYDSLPKDYRSLVRSPKAVHIYHSEENPAFNINISAYATQDMQSTVIEFAQYTLVITRDGKLFAKTVYLLKNKDQLKLEVEIPENSEIWYVLVGGEATEILFEDDVLIIPLIRSTLTGRNIAYPVEIIYVVPVKNEDMRYYLPTTNVPIILTEANIGIPSSYEVKDPQRNNPNFEFVGEFEWRNLIISMPRGTQEEPYYNEEYYDMLEGTITEISHIGKRDERSTVNIMTLNTEINTTMLKIMSNDGHGYTEVYKGAYEVEEYTTDDNSVICGIQMDPGQYRFDYNGESRTMTVLPGTENQLIMDSGGVNYIAPPPLIIDLPESGKILRFRKIYTTSDEELNLTVSQKETSAQYKPIPRVIEENPLVISVIGITAVTAACLAYFLRKRGKDLFIDRESEDMVDGMDSNLENEASKSPENPAELENEEQNEDKKLD